MGLGPKAWLSTSVGFELGTFQSNVEALSHCVILSCCKFVVYIVNYVVAKKYLRLKHVVGFPLSVWWKITIHLRQWVVAVLLVLILSSPLCPVSAVRNAFFLTPAANPFYFQVIGSNIRFFTYKAFIVALVF